MSFKLTYATMFDPPEELHTQFEKALAETRATLGKEYGLIIGGKEVKAAKKFEKRSPINTDWVLGVFQKGGADEANAALAAARKATQTWGKMPWQERVRLMRKAVSLIEERLFQIAAALTLEVGKNRLESLGDITEAADLIAYCCDEMERNNGYVVKMGKDPLVGYNATNTSVLKPYGVWVVISPYNFPTALSGGPMGAALVAGNPVVLKPASDTPWSVRLLAECIRDAGLPEGAINFVTGGGADLGQALIDSPEVDGITFTGSYGTGMGIYRSFANYKWPRPTVLELGGKNAVIVSRNADLDRAAIGIVRSAFGLQGQKCSAASRIYVEAPAYDDLMQKVLAKTNALVLGDPTKREVYLGPVINKGSYAEFQGYCEEISQAGGFATGGKVRQDGDFAKGYFCEPTIGVNVRRDCRLWQHEMFLPITFVEKVGSLDEGMKLANDVNYGLTSGFYGTPDEARWFFDNIEAGVNYANRPQGASTGAWPGFQPFGGWKASGSSGKNAGGHYYLPLYMHEHSQTIVD